MEIPQHALETLRARYPFNREMSEALDGAFREVAQGRNPQLSLVHLLASMLMLDANATSLALTQFTHLDVSALRSEMASRLGTAGPNEQHEFVPVVVFGVLDRANYFRQVRQDDQVSTYHVLLALHEHWQSIATPTSDMLGVTLKKLRVTPGMLAAAIQAITSLATASHRAA